MKTVVGIVALAVSTGVLAAEPVPTLRDPFVPPAVAKKALEAAPRAPSRGEQLHAEVERKLRSSFEAADVERRGSITRVQARAAGLGRVAREFGRIDVDRTGRVSFEDYRRFLVAQGAAASLLPAVPVARPR